MTMCPSPFAWVQHVFVFLSWKNKHFSLRNWTKKRRTFAAGPSASSTRVDMNQCIYFEGFVFLFSSLALRARCRRPSYEMESIIDCSLLCFILFLSFSLFSFYIHPFAAFTLSAPLILIISPTLIHISHGSHINDHPCPQPTRDQNPHSQLFQQQRLEF